MHSHILTLFALGPVRQVTQHDWNLFIQNALLFSFLLLVRWHQNNQLLKPPVTGVISALAHKCFL